MIIMNNYENYNTYTYTNITYNMYDIEIHREIYKRNDLPL